MGDISTQEEQKDVEVVQRAAEPAVVENIQSRKDLVDREEGRVPDEEPDEAEEDYRAQQDVDGAVGDAYHLKNQLANHFTLNQLRNPVLIPQHACSDKASELVLQEGGQMEVRQVEAGSRHEGQEEEAPQEQHAHQEIGVLFAQQVSLQKRVLKVSLLLGSENTRRIPSGYLSVRFKSKSITVATRPET